MNAEIRFPELAEANMPPIPANTDIPEGVAVWTLHTGRYPYYRAPALLVTLQGAILAFCEGRSGMDTSDIDILVKRSEDGGRTWSDEVIVWGGEGNTCGNICPVLDEDTGTIWLAAIWNHIDDTQDKVMNGTARFSRYPYIACSTDDGRTWAPARNVTAECKHPDWRWYGTGPGVGIQIKRGPHKGRLIIPCCHSATYPYYEEGYAGHIMYSDDHGVTWTYGAAVVGMAEPQIVELTDGRLLMHGRNQGPAALHMKIFAYGHAGGTVWSPPRFAPDLTEPKCQSSLIRYSWPEDAGRGGRSRILFSNPAGQTLAGAGKLRREKLVARISYDEGRSWAHAKMVEPQPAGYSCLTALPDGDVGCIVETGPEKYTTSAGCVLRFSRFSIDWLTDGKDRA
jgi:sialidase-1